MACISPMVLDEQHLQINALQVNCRMHAIDLKEIIPFHTFFESIKNHITHVLSFAPPAITSSLKYRHKDSVYAMW